MYEQNRSDWMNKLRLLHAIGRYAAQGANESGARGTTRYYYHKQY